MIYIKLFLQFFQTGLFSFGGGYATLPFLYHIAETQKWYSVKQLSDMIAISAITPGPVGINMATFAGFITKGFFGALIATTAIILPSYIIVILVSKIFEKFKTNVIVNDIIYVLKPISCGLLVAIGFNMLINNISFCGILFLAVLILISIKQKYNPLFYLSVSAIFGFIVNIFQLHLNILL